MEIHTSTYNITYRNVYLLVYNVIDELVKVKDTSILNLKRAENCVKNESTKGKRVSLERDREIWNGWKGLATERNAMSANRFLNEISRHKHESFYAVIDQGMILNDLT